MITLDEALFDVQQATSDTTSDSQSKFVTWLNQGYQNILATFGRPGIEKTINTTTNVPSNPLAATDRSYQLPPDCLFVKTVKVQIGSRWYQLIEEESQEMWNYRTEYIYGGIPGEFFINMNFGVASKELQIDPICTATSTNAQGATIGVPMQIVYESSDIRLDHLGIGPNPAYSFMTTLASNLTFTYGTNTVTASAATFNNWMALGSTYVTTGDDGDGNYYKITAVNGTTSATIGNYYQGTNVTSSSSWSINQIMSLHVDMQDIPELWALYKYYGYKKDSKWRTQYQNEYNGRLQIAKGNWATKTRSSIIRSKQGISRWHAYPGYFPAQGVSS